jgi:hypothetical protein
MSQVKYLHNHKTNHWKFFKYLIFPVQIRRQLVHSFGRLVSNWPGSNLQIIDSFEIEVDI